MNREGQLAVTLTALLIGLLGSVTVAQMSSAQMSSQQTETGEKRRLFEFHSHCGLNLHHFLYWKAHPHGRQSGPVADWPETLDAQELEIIREAVDYYRRAFEGEDLLFAGSLSTIKQQLIRHDGGASFTGLGLERQHAAVLERLQPIYRWHLWPAHEAANRRWIEHASADVSRWGAAMVARLEGIYEDDFPPTPIRLDAVIEGHWAGAYTTTDPVHIVITSTREDYQGKGALEMVFHEASHGILGPRRGPVIDKLHHAFDQRDQRAPRDLWHALLFYTAGRVAQDLYRQEGQGSYKPYAYANGLYNGAWGAFLPPLESDWQAYLDGEMTMDRAVQGIVTGLTKAEVQSASN